MGFEVECEAADNVPAVPQLCRYLSERSPQPMVAVDGNTHVVSYVNPAFAQLVRRQKEDLVGRPFAEAVPEGTENGCLKMLDRVFRTGKAENLAEQEHRQLEPGTIYWSYAMWAILGADGRPVGVMIQITDATETALFRHQSVAINESLLISSTKQHELTQVAEALSTKLQPADSMWQAKRDRAACVLWSNGHFKINSVQRIQLRSVPSKPCSISERSTPGGTGRFCAGRSRWAQP